MSWSSSSTISRAVRTHLLPVLDGVADLAEDLLERLLDLVGVLVGAEPADLDVHPRLADRARPRRASSDSSSTGCTLCSTPVMSRTTSNCGWMTRWISRCWRVELHRHRVDEERHVVGDDLDDRVAAGRPAVVGVARGEDVHVGAALRAVVGEPELRGQGGVQVDVGAVGEVVGGDVAVVGLDQAADLVGRRAARIPCGPSPARSPGRAARTSSGRSPLTRPDSTTLGAPAGATGQR